MSNLLNKELKLALHPLNIMFLGLNFMLFIPQYPFYISFFYTCLGIFFLCLFGRENRDIYYMINLPIRKRDIVKARFMIIIFIQLLQLTVAIPFAIIRAKFMEENPAGIEANVAFFGLSFILFAVFNFIFLTSYYKNVYKVGVAFVKGSIGVFLCIFLFESLVFMEPTKEYLDTTDGVKQLKQLPILAIGILIYILSLRTAYRISGKRFEKQDL